MAFSSESPINSPINSRMIVYTDATGIGGAEISLKHLVATASADWEITVVGVSQSVVDALAVSRPQAKAVLLPPRSLYHHWACFRRLAPRLIHFNCCTPWANRVGLLAGLLQPQVRLVRVDQLPLRTADLLTLGQVRALCLRLDAHVAVGEASARRMEDFYALGRHSVLSIPNGVPDSVPDQLPAATPLQSKSSLTVGSIGRLDAMKGHDLLLRAIAQVEGLDLVILGEGGQRSALEQLAQDLQITDRVDLKGWVDHPRDFLPSFDLVALPSRSEGFPLVMVEAMLAARPIVATRVGSVPEAIISGETGLLIEKDDLEGLVRALIQLRDQPQLRQRLGHNAQVLAKRYWTVESMTNQYEQLWRHLLATPAKPRLKVARPRD
jgi:glycosyltransferase involved in cell wall biosynthesis